MGKPDHPLETGDWQTGPLNSDSKREAVPAIRGYVYQITQTALAWAELRGGERIYLEQAEDFDLLGRVNEAVQVKDYQRSITLRTPAVQEFICNAWLNRRRNPGRNVLTRLLTTAIPTTEQGAPFGKPGIDFWMDLAGKEPHDEVLNRVDALASYLLVNFGLPDDMRTLLESGDADAILRDVVTPVTFDVGLPTTKGLERRLEAQLALVATKDGFRLTSVKNAVNATLKSVWDTVQRSSDRVLEPDALVSILRETTQTIPPRDATLSIEEFMRTIVATFATRAGEQDRFQLALPTVLRQPPPTTDIHLARTALIAAASSALQRATVAVIEGQRFVGKTTLAIDVANAVGGAWVWTDAGTNPTATLLQATSELMAMQRPLRGFVIDKFPQNDEPAVAALFALLQCCRNLNIAVVIVSDGDLSAVARQRLNILPESEISVRPFNNAEISALLLTRGCPPADNAVWTRALELSTAGEPLLVSSKVASLEVEGWPQPDIDDLFGRGPELAEIRRDIRLIAAQNLEPAQLELLNRLSISPDAYSRSVVLRLANEDPAVPAPGNALDSLVGIWVQQPVPQHYRVAGLALNFGAQTYGSEWTDRMHRAAARAILSERRISTLEAANALSHAFAGRDGDAALQILHQVIGLDGEMLLSFAECASWLPFCCTGDSQQPDFINSTERWVLRAAQIRVTTRLKSANLAGIVTAFEAETSHGSEEPSTRLARLVVLSELLIRSKTADFAISQIASYAVEWAELAQEFTQPEVLTKLVRTLQTRGDGRSLTRNTGLYIVGFSVLSTVTSASSLHELISALSAHGVDVITAFFGALNDDRQLAHGLLLRLWSSHIGAEDDRWAEDFESLISDAKTLLAADLVTVADEALAAAIRLKAERGSAEDAARTANELLIEYDKNRLVSLRRAEARALMLDVQYLRAAEALSALLPYIEWDGTDFDLFVDYRDAAISYARVNHWSRAAAMLEEGAARTDEASLGKWKAALEFDAAAAYFRAQQFEQAVPPLIRGCQILSRTQIDQNVEADYMIMKRIGHTASWLADPADQSKRGFDAPPPAVASSLDTTRPQTVLPATEVDMVLAMASQYVYMYGTLDEAAMFDDRTLQSPHTIARLQALIVSLYRSAENGDAERLISDIAALSRIQSMLGVATSGSSHNPIALESFAFGLIVPGLQNRIDQAFIVQCRHHASRLGVYEELREILDHAENVFVKKIIAPKDILYTARGPLKYVATVAFAASLGNQLGPWLVVHTFWTEMALTMFTQPAGAFLYRLLISRWSILLQHPILFSYPAVTAPRLEAAIGSRGAIWNRISELLEAAADAAGSVVPTRVKVSLQSVVLNPRPAYDDDALEAAEQLP